VSWVWVGTMRAEILILALLVGSFTWAFRFFPTRADLSALPQDGPLSRFLAATGPAAIATLFTASALPYRQDGLPLPLILGTLAVLAIFAASRSVVGATMAGSAAYGLGVWLI
jgi:Branched-chain amino acid transport protein (AzlD)